MPQISQRKLDKTVETEMYVRFWQSISRLQNSSDAAAFFSDLLTQTEEVMLAKRFMIAILLSRGKKPVQIGPILHVSFSTIAGVSSWVKNAKPRTKKILEMMINEGDWQAIFDRFNTVFDLLPPGKGADWHRVGKDKWKRKQERSARESLR